ncbi:MAG: hypothetical protein BWY99_02532 [Synergistetes bacterium ADurb.BinA166]|nr:MAG: hypothetical protein BWY99_02532 [Synergistetes bacterium ADurb.BinA166]
MWVPLPTIRPSSTTRIRSASFTVLTRWAITISVAPLIDFLRAFRRFLSVSKSRAEKESSKT